MKEFMLDINYINSHDSDSTFHRSILNFSSDMSIMFFQKYIERSKTSHNFASSNHPLPSTPSLLFLGRQVLAMFRAYCVKASEVNLFSVELLLVEWIIQLIQYDRICVCLFVGLFVLSSKLL